MATACVAARATLLLAGGQLYRRREVSVAARLRCDWHGRTEGGAARRHLGLSLTIGNAQADANICGPSLACGAVAKGGLRRHGQHLWSVCGDEGAGGVVGRLGRKILVLGDWVPWLYPPSSA